MRSDDDFIAGLHSLGDLSPDRRLILHFPEEKLIWSVGSGYGGNALLGKKCHALRIASAQARQEGWLAEHMLIIGVEDPEGRVTYLAGAMPSASGKTNLAMAVSQPAGLARVDGGRRHRLDARGRDRSAPRDQPRARLLRRGAEHEPQDQSQRHRHGALEHDLHQRGADAASASPGGKASRPRRRAGSRTGRAVRGTRRPGPPRIRTRASPCPSQQCPSIAPNWEDPQGVPISGLIFGSRRTQVIPLVFEAFDWNHGVFLGSAMSTETTAAITGKVGVVRRDPMAMLPFCGYNMADYFTHWLSMQPRLSKPPRIFRVNWFRRDADGKFLWPGYGENVRVLKWMVERIRGGGQAQETPIGYVPAPGALDLDGLDVTPAQLQEALRCDAGEWLTALQDLDEFYGSFGSRLPATIARQLAETRRKLGG